MHRLLLILSAAMAILSWAAFRPLSGRFDPNQTKFKDRYGEWAIVLGASEGLGAAWADAMWNRTLP